MSEKYWLDKMNENPRYMEIWEKIKEQPFNETTEMILDLEAKLEEKTRIAEGYCELFDKKQHENYEQFCEIQELKKQLEYIAKNKYEERLLAYERKVNQLKQQLAELEEQDDLYHNQLAISELQKVKEKVLQETNRVEEIYSDGLQSGFNCCYVFTREIIDQQIKALKGEKDEH